METNELRKAPGEMELNVPTDLETGRSLIAAWRTNNPVTMYLRENLQSDMPGLIESLTNK